MRTWHATIDVRQRENTNWFSAFDRSLFEKKLQATQMKLGHAGCRVVLLARNCCVTTVLSYFVVDALLGHLCRDRARDCTTDSSPQSIAHYATMPSASRARRRAEFPPWSKLHTSQEWVYFPPKNSVGVPMLSLHAGCMRHVFFLFLYFFLIILSSTHLSVQPCSSPYMCSAGQILKFLS
jgi:hypothetical protein